MSTDWSPTVSCNGGQAPTADLYAYTQVHADAEQYAAILTARAVAIDQILRPLTTERRADLEALVEELLSAQTVHRIETRRSGIDYPGGWTCRLCDQRACGRDRGTCPTANVARDLETTAEVQVGARKSRA